MPPRKETITERVAVRQNDKGTVTGCVSPIQEFGFKIPVLARSDGEVVDGHLRLKAARKLGSWPGGDILAIPVILCDEWTAQQVKAFRLMVNRSVGWADWDEELLSLELQELNAADFAIYAQAVKQFELRKLEYGPRFEADLARFREGLRSFQK